MDALARDLVYAARLWRRRPGPLAAAIVALALAIGANTVIFSVVSGVLLRPLPYEAPDRLVMIWQDMRARGGPEREWASPGHYNDWRARGTMFDHVGAVRNWGPNLTGLDEPERLRGALVSHGYFGALGVPAAHGRTFTADEDVPGGPAVAVLGHGLWQRRFGGDASIIGRTLPLDGQPTTIVGVMPATFRPPVVDAEIWSPIRINPAGAPHGMIVLRVLARLKEGATLAQAQSEMAAVAVQIGQDDPEWRDARVNLVPLHEDMVGAVRPVLLILSGAVGLVLLIACANVASLLLARASERVREITIRTALGAGRRQIVRQLLAESLLLSIAGGVLGLVLAWWGVRGLVSIAPPSAPRMQDVQLDLVVLAFAVGISIISALLAGVAPAVAASRIELSPALRDGGRESTAGGRLRSAMVVVEVATAMVLVVGAGLLVRSLVALQNVELGFSTDRIMTASIAPPRAAYRDQVAVRQLQDRVLAAASRLPGVEAAALTSILPLGGTDSDISFAIHGRAPARTPADEPTAWFRVVSAGYFDTLGIRVLDGRGFTSDDRAGGAAVAAVNETLARRYWPGESPIGRRIRVEGQEATVVGIVADLHQRGPSVPPQGEMFLPQQQFGSRGVWVALRTAGDPAAVVPALRRAMRDIDPNVPLSMVMPLAGLADRALAQPRFLTLLLSVFSGLAAVLALVGVYSVLSFSVSRRVREIGVRMALGAGQRSVVGLILRQSLTLVALGIVLGSALAAVLSRLMTAVLFEVSPGDPVTILVMAALIALAAAAASYGPARRASRVDPLIALRDQ